MKLFVPNNGMQKQVLKEVFERKVYPAVLPQDNVDVIVDVGANHGVSVAWWHRNYPNAQIKCFEPNPACWEILLKNTGNWCEINCFGLGDLDEKLPLYFKDDSVTGCVAMNSWPEDWTKAADVDIRKACDYIEKADILKLDCECYEYLVLKSLEKLIPEIRQISFEYHATKIQQGIHSLLEKTHYLYEAHVLMESQGVETWIRRGEVCR